MYTHKFAMSASLIGHSRSSAFRLSAAAVSMSLTGSCFSSESAPRPFHHGPLFVFGETSVDHHSQPEFAARDLQFNAVVKFTAGAAILEFVTSNFRRL